MGVGGCSWAGEPTGGDFGGEITADFVGFLKNFDADLLGGGGCGGEGSGFVVEEDGDCGDGVSSWGSMRREE